jgi:phosphatidylserine/phosphatidylglycerophosphate/cardiolipin synthase-like enzyme
VAEAFLASLLAASRRGVGVWLLLDDFGCRLLRRRERQRLRASGIRLVYFNPLQPRAWLHNLLRDHRKLLVVDGRAAFTGGAGLTDQFSGEANPGGAWHEVMLEIRGPVVADWQALFAETWQIVSGHPLEVPAPPPARFHTGRPGRVAAHGRTPRQEDIVRSLLKRIRRAERRVWLATAYFLPSWKLRRALKRSARAGIDVRLLLPGPVTDHPSVRRLSHRYYGSLLRSGVRIFEYQPRFLHAKVQLCDGWASIGSSNLDRWNLRWNLEANQELEDPEILQQLEALFREGFSLSREVRYRQWLARPWWLRLQERVLAWVEGVVRRVTEGRRPGPPA